MKAVILLVGFLLVNSLAHANPLTEALQAKCKALAVEAMEAEAHRLRCVLDDTSVELNTKMSTQSSPDRARLWYAGRLNCVLDGTLISMSTLVVYNKLTDKCSLYR